MKKGKVELDKGFSFKKQTAKVDYPQLEKARKKAKEVTKMLDSLLDR